MWRKAASAHLWSWWGVKGPPVTPSTLSSWKNPPLFVLFQSTWESPPAFSEQSKWDGAHPKTLSRRLRDLPHTNSKDRALVFALLLLFLHYGPLSLPVLFFLALKNEQFCFVFHNWPKSNACIMASKAGAQRNWPYGVSQMHKWNGADQLQLCAHTAVWW